MLTVPVDPARAARMRVAADLADRLIDYRRKHPGAVEFAIVGGGLDNTRARRLVGEPAGLDALRTRLAQFRAGFTVVACRGDNTTAIAVLTLAEVDRG
jgi:hypothetical protein